MIEIYEINNSYSDRYMVIIDNPDRDLLGHEPYYDISINTDGEIAHGAQWTEEEVQKLRKRANTDYSKHGASYGFKPLKAKDIPVKIMRAILVELENDEA